MVWPKTAGNAVIRSDTSGYVSVNKLDCGGNTDFSFLISMSNPYATCRSLTSELFGVLASSSFLCQTQQSDENRLHPFPVFLLFQSLRFISSIKKESFEFKLIEGIRTNVVFSIDDVTVSIGLCFSASSSQREANPTSNGGIAKRNPKNC